MKTVTKDSQEEPAAEVNEVTEEEKSSASEEKVSAREYTFDSIRCTSINVFVICSP